MNFPSTPHAFTGYVRLCKTTRQHGQWSRPLLGGCCKCLDRPTGTANKKKDRKKKKKPQQQKARPRGPDTDTYKRRRITSTPPTNATTTSAIDHPRMSTVEGHPSALQFCAYAGLCVGTHPPWGRGGDVDTTRHDSFCPICFCPIWRQPSFFCFFTGGCRGNTGQFTPWSGWHTPSLVAPVFPRHPSLQHCASTGYSGRQEKGGCPVC